MRKRIDPVCRKHPELNGSRRRSGHCVGCAKEASAKWYQKNKEVQRAKSAKYHKKRGFILAKARYEKNLQQIKMRMAEYRERNRDRAAEATKLWRKANYKKARAHEKQNWAIRYSLIGGQKLAKKYAKETRKIYFACPEGFHVDHVIPLRGKGVSGLHVPWNLQYLPAVENQRKGNRGWRTV